MNTKTSFTLHYDENTFCNFPDCYVYNENKTRIVYRELYFIFDNQVYITFRSNHYEIDLTILNLWNE